MKKVLYLECKTGAAGDMLMGALYSLLTEEQNHIFEKNKCNQRRSARNSAGNMQTGNRWHSYES